RPVTNHHESGRHGLSHPCEDLDDVSNPLHRSEVREVHQYWYILRNLRTEYSPVPAPIVEVGIHEIRDHLHVVSRAAECANGLLAQKVGHGGYVIRLLYRELRNRMKRRVLTHDGDVRAMQRRDEND